MVSVCGVVVATIALVCALSVYNGFNDLVASLFSNFDPELKVTPRKGKVFDPNAAEIRALKEMPGIDCFSEVLQDNALVRYGDRQGVAVLKGVDERYERLTRIDSILIDGTFRLKDEIVSYANLGIGMAFSLGINAGFMSPLEIYAPKRNESVNMANPASSFNLEYAYIGSVFRTDQQVYDDSYVIVPLSLARSLFDYDKENLICYDKFNYEIPFLIVSKQDGSITKEIKVPFKEKKLFHIVIREPNGVVTASAGPGPYSSIIPLGKNWLLFEASSDTIYTLMPDYSLRPFIVRTPPIHTMDPEVYPVLRLVSDRYYFMESIKNVYDFSKDEGFPKKYFIYDTQEKDFFSYIIYNGDYTYKKELYMVMLTPANSKGELWAALEAFDLCKEYEKGKLKGKLKNVAAKLGEDDNPVVMLVKHKR